MPAVRPVRALRRATRLSRRLRCGGTTPRTSRTRPSGRTPRSARTPAVGSDTAVGDQLELSIVMPCLNEARTVRSCIEEARDFLRRRGVVGEIVVADNGSTDGSREIAAECGARVVDVPERGYGAALQAGIAAARGRYVVMGDADGSYDFAHLDGFLERLRRGDELVMGNRYRGGIEPGAMPPLHRYLGNPVLSHPGPAVLRQLDRRLPLRAAGVRPGGGPAARPADHGDGVRQRDGRPGRAGRPRGERGPHDGCGPTGARVRATSAAGATAGGTCGSSCSTRRAGCSSTPASR